MTPKEKALELIERFAPIMPNEDWREKSKQCAIIAVDEIINQTKPDDGFSFWNEVKTEIEKL